MSGQKASQKLDNSLSSVGLYKNCDPFCENVPKVLKELWLALGSPCASGELLKPLVVNSNLIDYDGHINCGMLMSPNEGETVYPQYVP